ncbi:MAG: hypothetical protein JXR83_08005 [Deltaproteobacteria bacterium]|nr:hypothetical protein [Deltaproteobacteria bacterium]
MAGCGAQPVTRALVAWAVLAAACAPVDDTPDVPLATLAEIAGPLSGAVSVGFGVSDKQSRLVNVAIQQGVGVSDRPATAGSGSTELRGLATSPDGIDYVFVWDSVADIGYQPTESVFVGIAVSAGSVAGIGDQIGPLVVDNSGLPRFYAVDGQVCRASSLLGSPTGDLRGKLYIGLWQDLTYPPTAQSIATADLGEQDFSTPTACADFHFAQVAPGEYQLIAILDDNNNNLDPGGFAADAGDLTNLGGTRVQVTEAAVDQDVVLNYAYQP